MDKFNKNQSWAYPYIRSNFFGNALVFRASLQRERSTMVTFLTSNANEMAERAPRETHSSACAPFRPPSAAHSTLKHQQQTKTEARGSQHRGERTATFSRSVRLYAQEGLERARKQCDVVWWTRTVRGPGFATSGTGEDSDCMHAAYQANGTVSEPCFDVWRFCFDKSDRGHPRDEDRDGGRRNNELENTHISRSTSSHANRFESRRKQFLERKSHGTFRRSVLHSLAADT